MKKTLIISIALLLSLPLVLNANPPKKINAEYNAETGMLNLNILHSVGDPTSHYIYKVVLTITDKETVKEYTSQTSKKSQDVSIEMPGLKKGAAIHITASCNKFGSKSIDFIVE
jgi:hypothetical protein